MTSSKPDQPDASKGHGGRQLVGEWAVYGIAAAASRFIPVPLLDDAVRLRATQLAVLRTLRAAGRTYSSDSVEALYAGADAASAGHLHRALDYLKSVPRRVLLFPIRKYVALFGSVKGVPTDVMHVLLLGRTVQHCLAAGRLAEPTSDADRTALADEAVRVRVAYDRAIHGMDLRLLTGALADGLSQGRGLTSAAVHFARHAIGRDGDDSVPPGEVEAGAERVEEVMRRPEISRLLEDFDTRFEAELSRKR